MTQSAATHRALITGITGQDGSYLAELLLGLGYEVHGVIRRASTFNTDRIEHLYEDPHASGARIRLHYGDLTDANGLARLVRQVQPTEVYNLGAQSHVRVSFDQPIYTADVGPTGTLKLLEAVRDYQDASGNPVRFYQASSSEMFGKVVETPQRESTPFIRARPTAWPSCTAIGSRSTTAKVMACTPRAAFYSTTNRRGAAKLS